jgi:hypothetical protein
LRGVNWDKIIAQPMTDASFCDWEKVTLGFLPQLPPVTVQLKLLYLHHGDVLTMLRGVGLLTPARTPSSPSASAISTAAEEKQTGDAATATAGSAASGSEETPPKETAASWTAKAAKRRSQRKGEEVTDWADRLLLYERPPKTWSRRTIANELYKLLRP